MRPEFDAQLDALNKELVIMGTFCENAIAKSAKALTEGNTELTKDALDLSVQIEHKEREIETMCLKLLLQQQPVAKDLRVISSALKMVTDMARIGDQSADIAEIIRLENIHSTSDTQVIHDMSIAVIKMVTDSIDAFVKKDRQMAKAVIDYDDVVDSFFNQVKEMLINLLGNTKADGEYAIDLLMIAKYFERIGDHAVNIAKWVLFSITGTKEG